jgi:BirA family biotin operon repressor/biotin-[acetyl-CoA-carboxylase] ligase
LGLNLTFSILLRPVFLQVEEQFTLSKIVAISVCDWIGAYLKDKTVAIKWPNDIYIGDSKVAGILIENSFSSSSLDVSVVGIGINLNQEAFSSDLPNPTSMMLETGATFDLDRSLEEFLSCFNERYYQAAEGDRGMIDSEYLNKLYRKDIYCTYRASNDEFKAKIVGVKPTGELMLQTKEGQERSFAFKEVIFVI